MKTNAAKKKIRQNKIRFQTHSRKTTTSQDENDLQNFGFSFHFARHESPLTKISRAHTRRQT